MLRPRRRAVAPLSLLFYPHSLKAEDRSYVMSVDKDGIASQVDDKLSPSLDRRPAIVIRQTVCGCIVHHHN